MENSESQVFQSTKPFQNQQDGYTDPKLMYSSGKSRLYRLKLRGKYFMAKTAPGNGENHDTLVKEFEIADSCSHPNIVKVFTLAPSTPVGEAIIMEYIEGRPLPEFLSEKPSVKEKERLIDQLLDAAVYFHKKGITHNDLKPENLLVRHADNSLVIIDFDFADDPAHYLLKNRGCTPLYAAPELISNHTSDNRSDIYSIGLLIKLICGSRYNSLVKKCLNDSPEKRFQDVATLKNYWSKRNFKRKVFLPLISFCLVLCLFLSLFYFTDSHRIKDNGEIITQNITDKPSGNAEINRDNSRFQDFSTELSQKENPTTSAPGSGGMVSLPNNSVSIHPSSQALAIQKEIEAYNQKMFQNAIRNIHESRYSEFGIPIIRNFEKDITANYDKHINETTDEATKISLGNHKFAYLSTVGQPLYEEMNKMPSLNKDKDMTEKELDFYFELLNEGKPFRPYSGESGSD